MLGCFGCMLVGSLFLVVGCMLVGWVGHEACMDMGYYSLGCSKIGFVAVRRSLFALLHRRNSWVGCYSWSSYLLYFNL